MYDFFADSSAIGEKEIIIRGSDLNHMKNVLRLQIGEQICIHEESTGKEYRCEIAGYEKDVAHLHIMWVEEANRELPSKIYLFQGLPKGDKMELIIQKAVELGVYEIIPVATKRAVVKLDAKKAEAKQKRWQSIAESAAKQSRRNIIPHIHEVVKFGQAVDYAKNLQFPSAVLLPRPPPPHLMSWRKTWKRQNRYLRQYSRGSLSVFSLARRADLMKVRLHWHRKMASARLHWENGSCGRKLPVWRCFRF